MSVVIPTVARPVELRRCLESIEAGRERVPCRAYVCDSSRREGDREAVRAVCERFDWVSYSHHDGANVAAARNRCAAVANEELLINVDDDVVLEPEAIERLLERYEEGSGPRIVAGSLSLGGEWTTPKKIRPIGYARPVEQGEEPDFVIGGYFLYPRELALRWPWNERIDTSDDIFIGAVWRAHGVRMLFAPDSRGEHPELTADADPERVAESVRTQRWHIYALLFDSLIANPRPLRALAYETLGFAASAKLYLFRRRWAIPFLRSWVAGHLRLLADLPYLRAIAR